MNLHLKEAESFDGGLPCIRILIYLQMVGFKDAWMSRYKLLLIFYIIPIAW